MGKGRSNVDSLALKTRTYFDVILRPQDIAASCVPEHCVMPHCFVVSGVAAIPSLPLRAAHSASIAHAELEPSSPWGCRPPRRPWLVSTRDGRAARARPTPQTAEQRWPPQPIHTFSARRQHRMKVVLALAMGAAALAPNQPQVAGKVAAKAAGRRALGAAMTLSSVPAFAAPGDSIRRTEPVARKEAADESSTTQLKYSYTNMPWEDLETSTAKFAPKTNWNTLYPEKRLRLEKKSPVARKDLAPAGNFETYAKTYPGLYSALSGLPMGETTPFLGAKPGRAAGGRAAKAPCELAG